MLVNHLSLSERTAIGKAVADAHDAILIETLNSLIWRRLLERWDQVIWRFFVFKTLRYRDLEGVWVKLFGPRPS
jgi:hypothetical protein